MEDAPILDDATRTELEAAAFRRLRAHLAERTDVQNIELMNLAGFCRNCLSRWYQEAAEERGVAMGKEEAREVFYGMPYAEWRDRHQREATPQQIHDFGQSHNV
jgi:hypothetical protein